MMLLTAISWAIVALLDGGSVEVEGLVISAAAKTTPYRGIRAGDGVEVEFSVSANTGGAPPFLQSLDSVRALDEDGKLLATPGESRLGATSSPQPNRRTIFLVCSGQSSRTLPFVEGTMDVSAMGWKTATFAGETLKPNAVIPFKDGSVKLTVLELEDGPADLRFRVTMPGNPPRDAMINGARLTLTNMKGKETPLKEGRKAPTPDASAKDVRLAFRSEKPIALESVRSLRLELPAPKGEVKTIRFRVPDVPVEETSVRRKR